MITECDLENGHNTVCCSNCTLSIRVLYNVLADDTSDDHQEMAADDTEWEWNGKLSLSDLI